MGRRSPELRLPGFPCQRLLPLQCSTRPHRRKAKSRDRVHPKMKVIPCKSLVTPEPPSARVPTRGRRNSHSPPSLSSLQSNRPSVEPFTDNWQLTTDYCSSGRSGLFGPPLCGGSAPATPPLLQHASPACWLHWGMCPIERVSPDHSHQSHRIPVGAGFAPALPPSPRRLRHPHTDPVGAGLVPARAHPKSGTHPGIFQRQQCIQNERGPVEFTRVICKGLTGFTGC